MVKYTVKVLTAAMNFDGSHKQDVHEGVSEVMFPSGCLYIVYADGTKTAYAPSRWIEVDIDKPKATS